VATASLPERLYAWAIGDDSSVSNKPKPLLLWGLTLGVLADFLDQLPPHNAVQLWSYPTFTTWDAQFIINILTAGLKKRNQSRLLARNQTAIDSQTEAIVPSEYNGQAGMKSDAGNISRSYAVGVMLDGYYDKLRAAAQITAATRMLASLAFMVYIIRRFRR
jgi:hypothetical protein